MSLVVKVQGPASLRWGVRAVLMLSVCSVFSGCNPPGRPGPDPEVIRPEALVDSSTLYKENCAGCHGAKGVHGATIPLANPVLLGVMGHDALRDTIAKGVPGALMPAFGRSNGGTLTDQQIEILTKGILTEWGGSQAAGGDRPSYKPAGPGDAAHGQQAYATACARCHGADGEGDAKLKTGSIVDPTYLALVSDQYLRNLIVGGRPDENMPGYRSDTTRPLTDQEITDIVAWLGSKRVSNPGQPYRSPATHE
jgi:mono/diheme cytochrome c family protein